MGMNYYIECDTVFTDSTLSTEDSNSLASCVSACDMYNTMTFYQASECKGISYISTSTTNNCVLKSGYTGENQLGTHSARLMTPYSGPGNGTGAGGYGGGGGGGAGTTVIMTTMPPAVVTYVTGGQTQTIIRGGSTYETVVGQQTIVSTVAGGSGGNGGSGGGGGGSGGNGGSGGSGGNGGGGTGGSGGGALTTVVGGVTYFSTYQTVVQTAKPEVSTVVSNGQTIVSTYGYSTVATTQYATATIVSGGSTIISTIVSVSPSITVVPSTVFGVSTQFSTIVSNGITTVSTYGITTLIKIVSVTVTLTETTTGTTTATTTEISTATTTGTTTGTTTATTTGTTTGSTTATTTAISVSISVSASATTDTTTVLGTITITEGGSQFIYITAPPVTVFATPVSSSSSFTCRTFATNYLNGMHGRVRKEKRFVEEQIPITPLSHPAMPGGVAMIGTVNPH
ncbi:hypothetical protein LTR78_004341 [Recurvomyces mirabilis]|uniref:Apple domain-containing protein n=1 Tax=Recurvomyces mirabilis TaxID=574656 RepID=A0AAE1C2N8_9PEZI|nr:hypothetical protein LTR78_004341 [Recurvomyces mirabilis]KAK5155993.1 hypothetical protein LTS14_005559 [Recurvomyces mirabilis]